jgi:ABC-2 type transport system ATP-binding protein
LVESSPNRAVWAVDTTQIPVSRVIARLSANLDIVDLTVEDPPVEDLVVRLYREFRV